MTTLELAQKISQNIIPAMIFDEIQEMDSYKKHLSTLKTKCKPLKGSKKQIAWAKKIRNEKLSNAAFFICINNAKKKGAELGYKNCLKGYDYSARLQEIIQEAYKFTVAESWKIIDNRF